MTFNSNTSRTGATDVIGPFSAWPRRRRFPRKAQIATAATVVAAGVFVHCVVPML